MSLSIFKFGIVLKLSYLYSMIYFITTEKRQFIKIGFTNNLRNRLVAIQNGNPDNIIVLKTINGGMAKEQQIHKELNNHHYNREWFHYNQHTIDYLNSIDDNDKEPQYMQYNPQDDDAIEKLYSERNSNIQIAKLLSLSIHKVRRVVKIRKLKHKYASIPYPKYYHHGGHDNRS